MMCVTGSGLNDLIDHALNKYVTLVGNKVEVLRQLKLVDSFQ